jgi:hypothetical protein
MPSSTASTNPVVPNNTYVTGQMPSTNSVPSGSFNLLSCMPHLSYLFSPNYWRQNQQQLTNRQQNVDTNDNYEIALECIEVNFKENYIGGGNQSSVFKGKWNGR